MLDVEDLLLPEAIIGRRVVDCHGNKVPQALLRWSGLPEEEASWMDESDICGQFPYFSLEDKAVSKGREIDTRPLLVYKRDPCKVVNYGNEGENMGQEKWSGELNAVNEINADVDESWNEER